MKRPKRAFVAVGVLLVVVSLAACAPRSSGDLTAAQKLVAPYDLTVAKPLGVQEVTLPDRLDPTGSDGFSAPFVYSLVQESASQVGYDLRPYLGTRVIERQYRLVGSDTIRLVTLESDGDVIAAYAVDEEAAPGTMSLKEVRTRQ